MTVRNAEENICRGYMQILGNVSIESFKVSGVMIDRSLKAGLCLYNGGCYP